MNPELRRNIWLELSSTRLITVPVILFLIFAISYIGALNHGREALSNVYYSAKTLFFVVCVLWGCKSASSSLVEEVNQNTWDFQRMSSMNAWEMTWGKIIGSTVHCWYAGLICFVATVIPAILLESPYVLETAFFMVLAAFIGHTVSFLISVHSIVQKTRSGRIQYGLALVFGIGAAGVVYSYLSISNLQKMRGTDIEWYGMTFNYYVFSFISLLTFLFWFLMGAYRMMRKELMFQSTPITWIIFMLYQMLYCSGFFFMGGDDSAVPTVRLGDFGIHGALPFCMFIGVVWTYLLVNSEEKTAVTFRKIFRAYQSKNWKKLFILTPRWSVTYLITIATGILTAVIFSNVTTFSDAPSDLTVAYIFAILLFILRDIAIIINLNLFRSGSRSDIAVMVVFATLYILLPALIGTMGGKGLMPLFFPISKSTNSLLVILAPLMEAAVALYLLKAKWNLADKAIEEG